MKHEIRNKKVLRLFCALFCIGFAVIPLIGQAAELYFEPKAQEFGVGQDFQIDLMLDTQEKEINAMEASIVFPEELVEITDIKDGSSILTLWVEQPSLHEEKITFAGIVPGGFAGVVGPYEGAKPGKILSIALKTKNPGQGEVALEDVQVLLHDGLGTPVDFSISNFHFSIFEDVEVKPVEPVPDITPPKPFTPEIVQHPELFDGKYFLVFSTTDKDSGISHYEVQETREKIQETKWQRAESPYVLQDQDLRSYIYIKAVDRAGNERIEVVEPPYPIVKWYQVWWIWAIILLVVIFAYFVKRKLWKKLLTHE